MLKIHKPFSKKLLIIPIASICIAFGLLGFYYLTYTPELSHAETITYEKTIDDITYMQEMTPEICQSMELGKQYQLTDIRKNFDGTQPKYWIARLKDNNCWMTQNLDLDIPAEGLKVEDTDILEDWNSTSDYPPEATQTAPSPNLGVINNNMKSWDPALEGTATYCNDGITASKCKQSDNPIVSVNNGHDAQGNYYSWGAATAGQAATFDDNITYPAESAQSICPKGWTLPTSGTDGKYDTLVKDLTVAQLTVDPYYFVYGGRVFSSSLEYAGIFGYYWSSMAYNNSYVFTLYFVTTVNPSTTSYRYYGLSVRCVARSESTPNNNVEVAVNPMISLNAVDEVVVKKVEANPSTADLNLKVVSNQPYSININAKDHAELTSNTTDVKIPSASGALNENSNEWGIKKPEEAEYTTVTTTPQLFYQSTAAEIKTIPFTIGISTAPDIPNGEYSTDITVTATQN